MYRDRLWTMRQYAGYATAQESNEPTVPARSGLDPASGRISICRRSSAWTRTTRAVSARWAAPASAIDTIEDMRTVFETFPLERVSTSMTINAPASVLLCMYELVAEEQGVHGDALRGTTQNDILKE